MVSSFPRTIGVCTCVCVCVYSNVYTRVLPWIQSIVNPAPIHLYWNLVNPKSLGPEGVQISEMINEMCMVS